MRKDEKWRIENSQDRHKVAKAHRRKVITICSGQLLFCTLFSSVPLCLRSLVEKTKPIYLVLRDAYCVIGVEKTKPIV